MKYQIKILGFVVALILSGTTLSFPQSPEQLFQKGLIEEEGEGDLNEAIDIYNKIVKNRDADKSIRAKALLHVGVCYEKLGKNEATKAYKQLISNFPGQKSEVTIARERLARLKQTTEKISKTPLTPKFTKIKIPNELSWSVKLSPDGKKLAFVSDKKLWMMPLSGNLGPEYPGAPVQLNTEGIEVEWTGLSWSRDGKWIAFNEYPCKNDKGNYIKNQTIYVIPSSSGKPRKVIENYRGTRVVNYRLSLSPDGKKLAFSSIEDNKQHIFSTSINYILPKKLVDFEAREPVFSPDGKYIVFVKDKNKGIDEGDLGLWLITANGNKPRKLADAGKASSPVWSPDGKMIAYLDYTKGKQINIVPFSTEGDNVDEVIKIRVPENSEEVRLLAGWTPDNKIGVLIRSKLEFGLFTLSAGGGQAAQILKNTTAYQPRWSRDSKQIFYVTAPSEGSNKSYRKFIATVPAKGGSGKPLQNINENNYAKQFAFQSGNRISPDGKWVVTSTWTPADTNTINVHWPCSKIWKISTDGEKAFQITNDKGNHFDTSPCWSPDGGEIAFIRTQILEGELDFYGDSRIYIINSNGENQKVIVPEAGKGGATSLIWSPNGKMLAWIGGQRKTDNLNIYNFNTQKTRIVGEVPASNVNIETAWSPDSKQVAFNDKEGKVIKIMNIENGSIEDIKTGLVNVKIYHLDWSPDGKKFVFGGYKGGEKEFWFMDNFLPLEKIK
jgi:Tol biopolymer transport system component